MKPERTGSALYVPADHERAVAKSSSLSADILIFDLEDGVAPARKPIARTALAEIFASNDSVHTRLVRINHRHSAFYADDIEAIAHLPVDGLMLSKVAGTDDIDHAVAQLGQHSRADLAIWCNVETPLGITNINAIAAHPNVIGLVAGTNDLANDLRIRRTANREGLMFALQAIVLAARAHNRIALDGTFVDLEDMQGLGSEAAQGRMLGFDGKTLIHPKQIEIANQHFRASESEIAEAKAIIKAYESAMQSHKAVTLLNGKMIEKLQYDRAQQLLATQRD